MEVAVAGRGPWAWRPLESGRSLEVAVEVAVVVSKLKCPVLLASEVSDSFI